MEYALEERIGDPDLFVGRKEELAFFLKWIDDIEGKKSQSTALLARRKMGKTALLERLFNITFSKNRQVIPFYYEVKEKKMWVVDFCRDFFLTFIYQYIAFKSRKVQYLIPEEKNNFQKVKAAAEREGLPELIGIIESVEYAAENQYLDSIWETVRTAPHIVAARNKEFVVQMIDEFQFINDKIYRDQALTNKQSDMAAGYLSTAESKIAPLLVSGSWVGWLMNELIMMLPARFNFNFLENMPPDEAVEMVYKYSRFFDVPISEEAVYAIAGLSEGSPFYINSIIRSAFKKKDLTSLEGLTGTLEFETLNDRGKIKSTWMEYLTSAFARINDTNAKNIVLHLSKNRDRELTRKEILDELDLEMSDGQLENRLKALVKADIIKQGQSNYDYRGVHDNIFDKVFRGVYEKEIRSFDVTIIRREYHEAFDQLYKKYRALQGKYSYREGFFAEFLILEQLRLRAFKKNDYFKSITENLPADFQFCRYSRVWRYDSSPQYGRNFNVDIFARAANVSDYSIIGEVKSRKTKKFSKSEILDFEVKFQQLQKLESLDQVIGFIFSRCGFTEEAREYCIQKGIAFSSDRSWFEGSG